jgi:heme/copper-type cytochrome/quinol oxidase subunit 2
MELDTYNDDVSKYSGVISSLTKQVNQISGNKRFPILNFTITKNKLIMLSVLIFVIILVILILLKPSFVVQKRNNSDDKKILNKFRLISATTSITALITTMMYLGYYKPLS